ncbi:MAG: hypothetical protein NTW16_02760, partial [Bacteroidetes bacterium]|nr:hypothetical protein [Bacteroidota bacterium]
VTSSEFVPGTLVLIRSFLNHNPWFDGDIVIITDGLEPGQAELFEIFPKVMFRKPGEDLLLRIGHLCNALPAMIPRRKRFYSIELFNLCGYDRLFFFDSDMLVTGNISELLSFSNPLMACSDQPNRHTGKVRDRKTFKRIAADSFDECDMLRNTFNAGFMVPARTLLDQYIYEELKELIHISVFRNIRTHNTDQVVFNLYFNGQVRILPLMILFSVRFIMHVILWMTKFRTKLLADFRRNSYPFRIRPRLFIRPDNKIFSHFICVITK